MSGGGGHGLGLVMAIIFLAGEMAGVGVLALPKAMLGTGPAGFALILYFTVNAMFAGSRLGMCWVMVTERFPEYQDGVRFNSLIQTHDEHLNFSVVHPIWSLLKRPQDPLESELKV